VDAARGPEWAPHWTTEKLVWRLRSPACRYLIHVGPEALAISTVEKRNGVHIAIIVKTFAGTEGLAKAGGLLSAICRANRTPLYLHCGYTDRIKFPSLPLPAALRPVPLNYIYRPLLPPAPSREDFQLMHFEFLDFDAY
jgi:hypothetical protein